MAGDDKTTGRLRWASQRHPKGRPRKSTALSVFRRLSRADLRPPSQTDLDMSSAPSPADNTLSLPQSPRKATTPEPTNGPDAGDVGAADSAAGEDDAKKKRRMIYMNMRLPPEETHDDGTPIHHYPRNKIRTAKYTPLTFIPKDLWSQYHNVANIYFTFIVILQVSIPLPIPSNDPPLR
jgi:Phospholipid-translocating ATPase N-terminal